VAQYRGHSHKGQHKDDIAPRSPKGWTFRKRGWKGLECNNDIRDQGLRQQLRGKKRIKDLGSIWPLYLKKDRKTVNGIRGWSSGQRSHLGSGGTLKEALYEIFRGKKAKQIARSYITSQKSRDWTLWRGRPPPKWLKSLLTCLA
jgi:hypothetical protein